MKQVSQLLIAIALWSSAMQPSFGEDLQERELVKPALVQSSLQQQSTPSEAFLLYLAEIEVVRGDMLDPVALTKGLARHSREKKEHEDGTPYSRKDIQKDEEAANE